MSAQENWIGENDAEFVLPFQFVAALPEEGDQEEKWFFEIPPGLLKSDEERQAIVYRICLQLNNKAFHCVESNDGETVYFWFDGVEDMMFRAETGNPEEGGFTLVPVPATIRSC